MELAVAAAAVATSEAKEPALATIRALLSAGASAREVEEWRRDDCALGRAGQASVVGGAVAELLMEEGADLPWHPLSLKAAARVCDARAVRRALKRLGPEGSERALAASVVVADSNGEGGGGGTILHLCAAACGGTVGGGTAEVCQLLLEHSARADAVDGLGRVPLQVAVAAGLSSPQSVQMADGPRRGPLLDTIRALLLGGLPDGALAEWRSADCALSQAAAKKGTSGWEVAELLVSAGAELPWFAQEELKAKCAEDNVPMEVIGATAAGNVLREIERWKGLNVKALLSCFSPWVQHFSI